MSTPNIFSYATKELSQDAFICWLVACATEATGPLQECGLAFVRALFRAGASDENAGIPVLDHDGNPMAPYNGPCNVTYVGKPCTQYNRIDVYFPAKVDGMTVSFSIEDKIDGQPGKDQLKKYLDSVVKDKQKKDLIKPIYFKTGYVFDDERESVEKDNYSVFKAEDLKKFLDCHPDAIRENQILCQYSEYLNDKIKTRAKALANWNLDENYVQWEFMLKLHEALRDVADEWEDGISYELSGDWNGLSKNNNLNSKSPWTQYWFSKHLFWRLDWFPGRQNPNLRTQLRLMIYRNSAGKSEEESDDMVYKYRDHFNRSLKKAELRTGGVRLKNVADDLECTIGSIETAKLRGMTESELREFLGRVTRVHIEFLKSIS